MMEKLADIGVFGGSGFYKFLDDIKEVKVETPYGMLQIFEKKKIFV